jgi:hypothetical protein
MGKISLLTDLEDVLQLRNNKGENNMTNLEQYFDNDLAECEEVMDWATSDERSGTDAWQIHADIITTNFDGDWCWSEAIELWDDIEIVKVVQDYEQEHSLHKQFIVEEA